MRWTGQLVRRQAISIQERAGSRQRNRKLVRGERTCEATGSGFLALMLYLVDIACEFAEFDTKKPRFEDATFLLVIFKRGSEALALPSS